MGGSKAYTADCHHLRISVALDEVRSYYKDISGVCVVLHTKGKKSERPHYHIFIKDRCRGDTVCERLVKHLSVRPKGQEEWSIRAHDNFEVWYNYAMDTLKGGEEIVYNMDVPRPEVKRSLVLEMSPATAGDPVGVPEKVKVVQVPVKAKKKDPAHIRFYQYVSEMKEEGKVMTYDEVCGHYVDWTGGNYALRYATNVLRYAYYNINGKRDCDKQSMIWDLRNSNIFS